MARKSRAAEGQVIQYTTLKVRLYPTPAQAELFEKTFGCCRYIWNQMLSDQQRFYAETGAHFIPTPAKYKSGAPFLKEVDNQALTQEYNKLAQAFRVFFKNPETFGHPRFKRKKDDRDSFTACNHVFESGPTIYTTRDGIRMTKAGVVKARFSRRAQAWWKLKRITVSKTKTGKYYCAILYECPVKQPELVVPTAETALGLKYSMQHFYVTDGGCTADPPRWLKQSQEKLVRIQQKLARMEPGSRNYEEMVQKYRLLHEHIANQRRDFLHKESSRIANGWDAVCMRDDALAEMSKGPLRKDAASSGFRSCCNTSWSGRGSGSSCWTATPPQPESVPSADSFRTAWTTARGPGPAQSAGRSTTGRSTQQKTSSWKVWRSFYQPRAQRKRVAVGEEEQGSEVRNTRQGVPNEMDFAPTMPVGTPVNAHNLAGGR